MTKNELAKEVAVSEKLHLSTTFQAVDGILRVIKQTLAKGEHVPAHRVQGASCTRLQDWQACRYPGTQVRKVPCEQGLHQVSQR